MSPVDELLQSFAAQATSMSTTIVDVMEAYRKEHAALQQKHQALQSALIAKARITEVSSDEQAIIMPQEFADYFASEVVKFTVLEREFYIHRSILQSVPFFAAKLEHWRDEPVQLPEAVTLCAFESWLKRMYLGSRLPAGNAALCAQIIRLAKYWLLDVVVLEMVDELLGTAKTEDIPILEDLAEAFDLPELSAATQKLKKRALCSHRDLETMVQQALKGDTRMQQFCTTALEGHPKAAAVLRKQFGSCDFFVPRKDHVVQLYEGFSWFWSEVKKAKLLDMDLLLINHLVTRLKYYDGYRYQISGGNDHLSDAVGDMIRAVAGHICTRRLLPADVEKMFTWMPKRFLVSCDSSFERLIIGLPLATSIEVFHLMKARISDAGQKTAAALLEAGKI